MLATSVGVCLFRFLLSLVTRLRLPVGRIALALRARFASLWRSILTFTRGREGQSYIRLHANNVPVADSDVTRERPQVTERAKAEEEVSKTLAAPPERPVTSWEDKLSKYRVPIPSPGFKFDPHPATPDGGSQRYKPRKASHKDGPSSIPAGQQSLLDVLSSFPSGWTRHVHPEGNALFYHEGLRIFTESDVSDRRNCEEVLYYATSLIGQAIKTNGVILDELTEIVLNVDNERHWHYYFVDHTNRVLFWVHQVDLQEDLFTDLQGITGYSHIRYLVENRYWYASSSSVSGMSFIVYDIRSRSHCEYYPHSRTLPRDVFENLRGMLNFAKIDMMTADSSPSPFTQDELAAILDLVNSLNDDRKISDPYSIWIIARLMEFFTEDQFLNFCGQECARLNADTSLFEPQTWNRSFVFQVVNWFLLGSPNEHAIRLQRVWVDDTIMQPRWRAFMNRLTAELNRYPIFSTVMLAVNFSFLAVPGVIATPASRIQIIVYCSVVSTIGSIVCSFTLSNVYSDPGLMYATRAAGAMRTLSGTKWGMACLAITHSLPIACLIWSIALFSTALAIQIFGPRERATVATLGVECLILILFVSMSAFVLRRFSRKDDRGDVVETSEHEPQPAEPPHDVERGSAK